MYLKLIANQAARIYKQRGGAEAAKRDGLALKGVLEGEGTLKDKAKLAAEALKTPGAAPNATAPSVPVTGAPGAARDVPSGEPPREGI